MSKKLLIFALAFINSITTFPAAAQSNIFKKGKEKVLSVVRPFKDKITTAAQNHPFIAAWVGAGSLVIIALTIESLKFKEEEATENHDTHDHSYYSCGHSPEECARCTIEKINQEKQRRGLGESAVEALTLSAVTEEPSIFPSRLAIAIRDGLSATQLASIYRAAKSYPLDNQSSDVQLGGRTRNLHTLEIALRIKASKQSPEMPADAIIDVC